MPLNRREFVYRSVFAGAGTAVAGGAAAAPAHAGEGHGRGRSPHTFSFSVLGTTDLHGHVFNRDYYTDQEFDDSSYNDVGLTKIAVLVEGVRRERPGADADDRLGAGAAVDRPGGVLQRGLAADPRRRSGVLTAAATPLIGCREPPPARGW